MSPEYMGTTEASRRSGLSTAWIRRLLATGRVEGLRLGHDWAVDYESLAGYLRQERKPGPKEYMGTTEASRRSGLSTPWIRRLLATGRVQGLRLGHDWAVDYESLAGYLRQERKPGPKPLDKDAR